jgi:Kdo2-lipid IVA lauroyltransferase/acyltransferase
MVIRNALVHGLKAILRCINLLPYSAQQKFGSALGYLCYWGIPKRRRVAKSNISICLSDHTHKEQKQILKAHFKSLVRILLPCIRYGLEMQQKLKKKCL